MNIGELPGGIRLTRQIPTGRHKKTRHTKKRGADYV
jgi:hypothetical protein